MALERAFARQALGFFFGLVGDPVCFPRFAAIGGEGLFEVRRIGVDA
jgi:hypothetical protein